MRWPAGAALRGTMGEAALRHAESYEPCIAIVVVVVMFCRRVNLELASATIGGRLGPLESARINPPRSSRAASATIDACVHTVTLVRTQDNRRQLQCRPG